LDSASLDAPCANVLIRPNSLAIVEMPIVATTPQPVRMNPRLEIAAVADAASFVDPSGVSRVVCRRAVLPERTEVSLGTCATKSQSLRGPRYEPDAAPTRGVTFDFS